jgi:hypothetical protein
MEKSRDGKDSDLQGGGLESAFLFHDFQGSQTLPQGFGDGLGLHGTLYTLVHLTMEKSRDGKDSDLQGGGLESAFLSTVKGK